jgi:hypothetical protein
MTTSGNGTGALATSGPPADYVPAPRRCSCCGAETRSLPHYPVTYCVECAALSCNTRRCCHHGGHDACRARWERVRAGGLPCEACGGAPCREGCEVAR